MGYYRLPPVIGQSSIFNPAAEALRTVWLVLIRRVLVLFLR